MSVQSRADSWRGVAAEEIDDVTASMSGLLRERSRRLLGSLVRPHRRPVALACLLILVRTAATLTIPYLVKIAIDRGLTPVPADLTVVEVLVVVVAAVGGIGAAANYGFLMISGQVGQSVLLELRRRLFVHVQELSLSFYERYTSGRIISRLTSDIDALSELLNTGLTTLVTSVIMVVAIAAVLLALDLRLGLTTLLAFPLVVLLTQWFRRQSERSYRAVRQAIALVIVHYTESLSGIRAVQAFRRERRNQEIFEDVNGRYREANTWSNSLSSRFGPGINLLGRVATTAVLLAGGLLVTRGSLTVGTLTAFVLYVRQFFGPVQDLSQFYNLFQAAAAALEKVSGVLEEEPTVPAPARPVPLPEPRGAVGFEEVTFAYADRPILHEVSLSIPAGQVVAMVGRTGAGKSTMARLISRFYDPGAGRVTLDGVDLRDLSEAELRRAVAVVTQETFLFSGDVFDNIAVGRPTASREEVEGAARAVGAHDFVSALPNGYRTDVRRRGVRLSSGQRQLVAFARAFLADPRVLILDEATSSLDLPSERLVQRALRRLLAGRTAIIIAHRLSTVEIADRVLVIDDGRIIEDGPPDSLRRSGGRYEALHQAWLESLA
ncbi:MAG: ABC transporter ATP-binding protein [Candidatus Dormibacteraceae bacterium]